MAHDASIREVFEDFIADKEYQGARPATLHFYRSNWEHFIRETGIETLEKLTLQAIRSWLLDHKELSPNTQPTYDVFRLPFGSRGSPRSLCLSRRPFWGGGSRWASAARFAP